VIINSALFIVPSDHPLGPSRFKILNRNTIELSDAQKSECIAAVRSTFPNDRTLMIAANWRHADYYLKEYRLYRLPTITTQGEEVASMGLGDTSITISSDALGIPDEKGIVLVFLDGDQSILPVGFETKSLVLESSLPLYYVNLQPHQQLTWQAGRFVAIP
jgi:hypothetical protein